MDAKAIQERIDLLETLAVNLQKYLRKRNNDYGGEDDEIVLRKHSIRSIVNSYNDAIIDYKKERRYPKDGRIKADKIAAITSYFILRFQPFHSQRTHDGKKFYASTGFASLANEAYAIQTSQSFLGIRRLNDNLYPVLVDTLYRARLEIHSVNPETPAVVQRLFETWAVIAMEQLGARVGNPKVAYTDI